MSVSTFAKCSFSSVCSTRFRSKALLGLGAGLSQSREIHDFFEDLAERVVVPLRKAGLQQEQVGPFFQAARSAFAELEAHPPAALLARFQASWDAFLAGVAGSAILGIVGISAGARDRVEIRQLGLIVVKRQAE